MKKIVYIVFLSISSLAFSQTEDKDAFVIANGAIAKAFLFEGNHAAEVKSVKVYNNVEKIPNRYQFLKNVYQNGLIVISLNNDENFNLISLEELNNRFNLSSNSPVFIDGNEIDDTSIKIFQDIIKSSKIDKNNLYLSLSRTKEEMQQ